MIVTGRICFNCNAIAAPEPAAFLALLAAVVPLQCNKKHLR